METGRSFLHAYDAYRNRDNLKDIFIPTLNKIASEWNLDSVKSCLAIGPGSGFYDIAFIDKCAANTNKFIAVDQDHDSAEDLKVRLRKNLPNVEGLVIESDFKNWKGPHDPVDLVLMFHVLYSVYYRGSDERRSLLRKVHDRWLTAGGFLAVLSASHTKSPGSSYQIFDRLGTPHTPWEEIEEDILDAGFTKKRVHAVSYTHLTLPTNREV